jgi:hypothetical protein
MASEVKTNKISPATGTDVTLGDASDTFTVPSGSAITIASGGDINVLSGGEIDIASSATLDVNGTIDLTGATTTGFPAGGLTTASQWRLTANFTGTATPIATNLEEVDAPVGFGVLGSSMTESSGIFTFPSTGYWMIKFDQVSNAAVRTSYNEAQIMTTTNDSTYVEAAWARSFNVSGPTTYTSSSCVYIMDVTSTSTHKVRFDVDIGVAGSITMGDSNINLTCMTFIKLADT